MTRITLRTVTLWRSVCTTRSIIGNTSLKVGVNAHQVRTRDMASVAAGRIYPLKKPPGHKPPVPRWSLKLPDDVTLIYTLYVGVQSRGVNQTAQSKAEAVVESILRDNQHSTVDSFRVTNGFDVEGSKVWVAYWTNEHIFAAVLEQLDLELLWSNLDDSKHDIGFWIEYFVAPKERLETNYARLDHKPGLAQLPRTDQPAHETTAYWGAARDRIPASAHDLFETPQHTPKPSRIPKGFGEILSGTNYNHICHIRSGQWWEKCDDEERRAYEDVLQGKLMEGMHYLWEHPEETGTIGLRFLQNLDLDGNLVRETCGAGFHKNWKDLEAWSSRHPSHLAIFNGAIAHAKRFGEDRKFMTWHEVWILKEGEAKFVYCNCDPITGVIKWVDLESRSLTT